MKENKTQEIDTIIVGGGLSGLSAAYFLEQKGRHDFIVLEQDSTAGGYCRTIPHQTYVWDYAGHFYHFRTSKYQDLFRSLVNQSEIIEQTKNTKIYYHDRLISYPFQMNIHQLEQSEFIDCLYDLYKKDSTAAYNTFLEMLYAKFGKSITEKFLKPYNEKLYAVDLNKLDKDAMGRFFPYADLGDIISNMKEHGNHSYNDTFLYLKHGTGYFIDRLYDIVKDNVKLSTTVTHIDPIHKIVTANTGERYHYHNLINSAPFNRFVKLLGMDDINLSYNKVLVLNLGFDKPSAKFANEHWVYFPDKTLNFYRIGFYNNLLNQDKLSVYVEIGFSSDETVNIDRELTHALDGMERVGIIDKTHRLIDHNAIIMDPAYVHISAEEDAKVQEIITNLEGKDIYTLGRYGRWTYNCMEDCIALADELVEKIA